MKVNLEVHRPDMALSDEDFLAKGLSAVHHALKAVRPNLKLTHGHEPLDEDLAQFDRPHQEGAELRAVTELGERMRAAYALRTERMLNDIGKLLAEHSESAS